MRDLFDSALRFRALVSCVVGAAVTLLFVFITARMVLGGVGLDVAIVAGLTLALAWVTRRAYRRYRTASDAVAAPTHVIYDRDRQD